MSIAAVIKNIGLNVIAQRMTVTAQRVCNWRTRGIPGDQVVAFCRAANWEITPHEINPDLYPNPHDGIPTDLRNQEAA